LPQPNNENARTSAKTPVFTKPPFMIFYSYFSEATYAAAPWQLCRVWQSKMGATVTGPRVGHSVFKWWDGGDPGGIAP